MTVCECITYICTCGSAFQDPITEADEYLEKYKIEEPEEGEEGAAELAIDEQGTGEPLDKAGAEGMDDPYADEEGARLLPNKDASVPPGQQRGCCMRIICLVFCCDTSNIGS